MSEQHETADIDLARTLYDAFLPPIPFRELDLDPPPVRAAQRPWGRADLAGMGRCPRVGTPRDKLAAEAMGRAEQQLRMLRPDAMAAYDGARLLGVQPAEAMRAALPREHGPGVGAPSTSAPSQRSQRSCPGLGPPAAAGQPGLFP
ncbi:MAG: hypothetical protein ACRD1K_15810 [Acidimicrobiales bacterium]